MIEIEDIPAPVVQQNVDDNDDFFDIIDVQVIENVIPDNPEDEPAHGLLHQFDRYATKKKKCCIMYQRHHLSPLQEHPRNF